MIKIEHTDVYGWEASIRGLRNPMNSWDRSDSEWESGNFCDATYRVGEADLDLMRRLAEQGPVHSKYLRMITVTADITAPLYWWTEYDTYKVGTVANSCSKMHKLLSKPFEMSDFSFDKLPGYKNEIKQFAPTINEDTERWEKYVDDYYVSTEGRVKHGTRILSGSLHTDGYRFVTIRGKQIPIHRVVASEFVPNNDNKPEVNHKDGNKQNNKAENLEWTTRAENQKHAVENGLQPKSTGTYKGKFTPEQRQKIKEAWDSGEVSRRQLALEYGVSHTCINDIVNDKYKYAHKANLYEDIARPLVDTLNELRDAWFLEDDDDKKKVIWYSILQMLPESYNQKRTVQLNYEVLMNIYKWRKNHKLDEWHTFCSWIEDLPYWKEIRGGLE